MRALLCHSTADGIEGLTLGEAAAPPLPPGGVRIRVRYAGINFADTLLVNGRYQERPDVPFAPGLEVSGTVIEVADNVAAPSPGSEVVAFVEHGGLAEEAIARSSEVWTLPASVDPAVAAAVLVNYGTAYLALSERARLAATEVLLVFGAAGGTGLAAVEVGKALGATVVAVASTLGRLTAARERGADFLVAYRTEDVARRVEELVGGVDVVFDPVGGDMFDAALHAIRPGGRILVVGFASGGVPQIPANHLLVKDASALGFSLGQMRGHQPEAVRAGVQRLLELLAQGALRPHVSRVFPFEESIEALRLIEAGRSEGKLVVRVGDD